MSKKSPIVSPGDPSDLLTMVSVASATAGIALTLMGAPRLAIVPLVLCGVCDAFDGRFASMFKRDSSSQAYGAEVDSIADIVSFGCLPVAMMLSWHRIAPIPWPVILVAILYMLCAVRRLAWFGALDRTGASGGSFVGVPVTYVSLVMPIIYTLLDMAGLSGHWLVVMPVAMALLAVAFVLNIRIPRPGKGTLIALSAIGVACAVRVLVVPGA